VSPDSHGHNDTVVTSTTAAQSPEEIFVLGTGGLDQLASSGDDLELESVISTETELGAQGRVTTTLGVTTSETNRGALAGDNDEALGSGSLKDLVADHTSGDLESRALVVGTGELLVLNVGQVVGPDREGTSTSRTSKVTMVLLVLIESTQKR
jgi:hypothetical protein